jgi:hypothetical protein
MRSVCPPLGGIGKGIDDAICSMGGSTPLLDRLFVVGPRTRFISGETHRSFLPHEWPKGPLLSDRDHPRLTFLDEMTSLAEPWLPSWSRCPVPERLLSQAIQKRRRHPSGGRRVLVREERLGGAQFRAGTGSSFRHLAITGEQGPQQAVIPTRGPGINPTGWTKRTTPGLAGGLPSKMSF